MDSDKSKMVKPHKGPFADAPVQKIIHLAKQFREKDFFNVSTNQKHESSMATMFFFSEPDKMRKFYKAHSIDASNQIFINLAVLEKKIF